MVNENAKVSLGHLRYMYFDEIKIFVLSPF